MCTYIEQPLDIAEAMPVGSNYLNFINLEVSLFADATGTESPELYEWFLTYVCTPLE